MTNYELRVIGCLYYCTRLVFEPNLKASLYTVIDIVPNFSLVLEFGIFCWGINFYN